jgi:hypothetical protein
METTAVKETWVCLLVSNVFHNGYKTDCCEIFASEHSGERMRRSACQAEPTPNSAYCFSVQKSLCTVLFVVQSTEIHRQLRGFSNRGIQTVGVPRFYFLCPRTMFSLTYVQFLNHVQKKATPKAST